MLTLITIFCILAYFGLTYLIGRLIGKLLFKIVVDTEYCFWLGIVFSVVLVFIYIRTFGRLKLMVVGEL